MVTVIGLSKKGQTGGRRTACAMDRRGRELLWLSWGRGREQGPVELPDLEISIWVRVLPLLPKGLQGVGAGKVPVVVLLV